MPDGGNPPSKPAVNGANGTAPPPPSSSAKPHFRQQPYRRNHHRSRRNLCCCFCFWSIVILLALTLLAAIAGAALYVLYRPHRPQFTISSLRISNLNLTTTAAAAAHLSSFFNLTLSSLNPNSHITFSYDPFSLSCFSNSVLLGNGSIPAFTSATKNQTVLRALISSAGDLDADSVTSLRSDLKKKGGGAPLTIEMDTKVKVKIGGVKTKKVGIRVTCEGIKAAQPKGKSPPVASVSDAACKVDLRIKIWIFTL